MDIKAKSHIRMLVWISPDRAPQLLEIRTEQMRKHTWQARANLHYPIRNTAEELPRTFRGSSAESVAGKMITWVNREFYDTQVMSSLQAEIAAKVHDSSHIHVQT